MACRNEFVLRAINAQKIAVIERLAMLLGGASDALQHNV
jgi:hypothetical protein